MATVLGPFSALRLYDHVRRPIEAPRPFIRADGYVGPCRRWLQTDTAPAAVQARAGDAAGENPGPLGADVGLEGELGVLEVDHQPVLGGEHGAAQVAGKVHAAGQEGLVGTGDTGPEANFFGSWEITGEGVADHLDRDFLEGFGVTCAGGRRRQAGDPEDSGGGGGEAWRHCPERHAMLSSSSLRRGRNREMLGGP